MARLKIKEVKKLLKATKVIILKILENEELTFSEIEMRFIKFLNEIPRGEERFFIESEEKMVEIIRTALEKLVAEGLIFFYKRGATRGKRKVIVYRAVS